MARLGLDKSAQAASRAGPIAAPPAELVAERLRVLREYRWSSYPGYAGYRPPLNWVWPEPLARLCGGNTAEKRRAALRQYSEAPARQGVIEPPWSRLVGGVVLGTVGFAEKLRQQARGNPREQKPLRAPVRAASWEQIVAALERIKGENWNQFAERHGNGSAGISKRRPRFAAAVLLRLLPGDGGRRLKPAAVLQDKTAGICFWRASAWYAARVKLPPVGLMNGSLGPTSSHGTRHRLITSPDGSLNCLASAERSGIPIRCSGFPGQRSGLCC